MSYVLHFKKKITQACLKVIKCANDVNFLTTFNVIFLSF